jgi:DNA-binding CsgD family transcriptional regulator
MAIVSDEDPKLRAVAGRVSPALLIVDLDLRPLGWSPNSQLKRIVADAGPDFKLVVANCYKLHEPMIHIVDEDTLLRIIPLETADVACVGIQVESFRRRSSFVNATKAYRLTKRETEILQLVVEGASNAQIAQTLFIAHSTVADIKKLMQKTQTAKRTRLILKFARDDEWRFAEKRAALEPL